MNTPDSNQSEPAFHGLDDEQTRKRLRDTFDYATGRTSALTLRRHHFWVELGDENAEASLETILDDPDVKDALDSVSEWRDDQAATRLPAEVELTLLRALERASTVAREQGKVVAPPDGRAEAAAARERRGLKPPP